MGRLIYVPQLPCSMRYSEWHLKEFVNHFSSSFDDVVILGMDFINRCKNYSMEQGGMFSPIDVAIRLELEQIEQFLDIDMNCGTYSDTLFLADISFPGFFSNVLYHRKGFKTFAYCHATSKNKLDYFEIDRKSKWLCEDGYSKLFDKIFVATDYHKEKLGWDNAEIVALPSHPHKYYKEEKIRNIISVARPIAQKVNLLLESKVEEKFGKIERQTFDNWDDYYRFVSSSRIMLITSIEETFGYQVLDAVNNNCIPLAPFKYSYPELLPNRCLYRSEEELLNRIELILNTTYFQPPTFDELKNSRLINNFYSHIIDAMKG